MKKIILIIMVTFTILFAGCTNNTNNNVNDFKSCVDSGFPVMETEPKQCRGPTGVVYFDDVINTVDNENTSPNEKNTYEVDGVCTMEYAPVCGVDDLTYPNKCMAGNIQIAYDGECKMDESAYDETTFQNDLVCKMEYVPVCGVDGLTYPNKCMAGNIQIAYDGECKMDESAYDETTSQNDLVCTMEYIPVCGVDGLTYPNKCMAGNVQIAYDGECDSQDE